VSFSIVITSRWPGAGTGPPDRAFELNRRLPGSLVCDPAHIGSGMQRMLPKSLRHSWQDIPPGGTLCW